MTGGNYQFGKKLKKQLGMQHSIKVFSKQNILPVKAPCLRTVPELYIGETYFVSVDGKNAQSCTLLDVFWEEKMVLVQIGERKEAFYWTDIGGNPSWSKRNQVQDHSNN